MDELKREIGYKIKTIRRSCGKTQIDICGDESELTIRQLARIENGQALATLPKLLLIADKLGVSLQNIVDVKVIEIPKGFLKLKDELIHSQTYADKGRIERKEAILEEIYENYYENLPEEEQLIVDVTQARFDIYGSSDVTYGLGLVEEYFQQLLKKKYFSVNDLLIIELYFFCCAMGLEDKEHFEELAQKVLLCSEYEDKDSLVQMEKVLLSLFIQIQTEDSLIYIQTFEKIIAKTRHVFYRPHLFLLKAKYALFVDKNVAEAESFYEKAISLAELLDDQVLVQKILAEKQIDFPTT
ncbi:TPA: helix-turn-helix domain-containing protein [Streptococcus pneumoniae]|uniref:XRE family transcriptional regulator n=2 Tax=Streptococcus pneumoniae TaxID=1313 RepID=A0A064C002_STREE|nr:XRE family transcriptional regulator [Streptococcus pneumoniae]EHE29918.1 helix-turn-helix family protein [Streptococcus pneumoniae GA43380]EOB17881.1 XRE family transcriptional regulator [Streptococcus pneumoniae 2009]EPD22568.1 XRE family transcriptional regulator [Streptococcus pneumoniae MNZ41]ETE01281.1 transcriptional regulator [Streptococcus pneumoniae 27]ETE26856.1 transcriptional regulator [Streptococcus pneumoniae 1719]KNB75306.1 transcriptional regulator [Streptococcus pneumonia